jgi:hypothetical protein
MYNDMLSGAAEPRHEQQWVMKNIMLNLNIPIQY